MKKEFAAQRLDIAAFAEAGAALEGAAALSAFERLAAESVEPQRDTEVHWRAEGEARAQPVGEPVPWLHLEAEAVVPMTCQRCLTPVDVGLHAQRSFRFVANETVAAEEDEEAEEDVLVLARDFDLLGLVEDELLMDIPVAPTHEVCPQPVRMSAVDPGFEAAESDKPNPFAALESLRNKTRE